MDSLGYSPAVEVSDEGEAVPVVERAAGKWEVAEPVVMEAVRPQSAQGLRSPLTLLALMKILFALHFLWKDLDTALGPL